MSSTPEVTSQIPNSEYRNYPLNSFSGEETALKVCSLVFAFLCIGGAVAIAIGGQFVLPEIIMAPIPQMIVESILALTGVALLLEVIVFSVKSDSRLKSTLELDPNIERAKLASFDAVREENKEAKGKIHDLQSQLEKTIEANSGLQEQIRALDQQLKEACQAEAKIQRLNEKHSKEVSGFQEKIADLRQELEEATVKNEILNLTYAETQSRLEIASKRLNVLEPWGKDAVKQHHELVEKYKALKAVNKRLQGTNVGAIQEKKTKEKIKKKNLLALPEVLENLTGTPGIKRLAVQGALAGINSVIEEAVRYEYNGTFLDITKIKFHFRGDINGFNELGASFNQIILEGPVALDLWVMQLNEAIENKNGITTLQEIAEKIKEMLNLLIKRNFDIARLFEAPKD